MLFEYIYAPRADTDYDAAILGLLDKAIALDPGNMHAYRTKATPKNSRFGICDFTGRLFSGFPSARRASIS